MCQEFLLTGMCGLTEDNGRSNFFSQARVRHRKYASAVDGGVFGQNCLDLQGRNLFAATINQILYPASDFQIAIFIEPAQIAGAVPIADESCRGCFRIIPVAIEDGWAARDDLSLLVRSKKRSITVDNPDLVKGRDADLTGFVDSGRQRVGGQFSGLARAIAIDDRRAKNFLQAADDARIQPA